MVRVAFKASKKFKQDKLTGKKIKRNASYERQKYANFNIQPRSDLTDEEKAERAAKKKHVEKATRGETYRTPHAVVYDLIKQYPIIFKKAKTIFDPAAGDGRYIHAFIKNKVGKEYRINELRKVERKAWKKHGLVKAIGKENCMRGDFFGHRVDKKFDLVITNPPFTLSEKFVDRMLKWTKPGGFAVILEKDGWRGGQQRALWMVNKPLRYAITISYRIAFDIDGIKSMSTTYCHCWYVFQKGYPKNKAHARFILRKPRTKVEVRKPWLKNNGPMMKSSSTKSTKSGKRSAAS